MFWWCLRTVDTDLLCITSSSLLQAVHRADLSWDDSSGCVCSSEAHWGSDSSRWWNGHASSLLPAPPTHHLQDWACQGATGSRPYRLNRDHSCVFSFSWYIHTRLMINQPKMAHTVWNTRQTLVGHSPPAPLRLCTSSSLTPHGSSVVGTTCLPWSPLLTGHLLGQLCWTGLVKGCWCLLHLSRALCEQPGLLERNQEACAFDFSFFFFSVALYKTNIHLCHSTRTKWQWKPFFQLL